jgi:S1-C subfamily serine protease
VSHGTGTCIGWTATHGLIVTAWHIVKDNKGQITVDFPAGRLDARVISTNRTWDLAALVVKRPPWQTCPFIRLQVNPPRKGDLITIAGYGSGKYREATGPLIQYVSPKSVRSPEIIEMGAQARLGDSGGPMLSANGGLVGVLFGSSKATYGSHCGRVRVFLNGEPREQYPNLIARALQLYPFYQPRQKLRYFWGFHLTFVLL